MSNSVQKDPVLVARSRLAVAVRTGGDVDAARRTFNAAKLERAVREAIAAAPPLTNDQKERIAHLLMTGGGAE